MAAKTKHRIIDELLDVRMVLEGSSPSRLLSIGTDWSQLRIAMRISMQDTGGNLVGTPRFAVGVCSGTAAPWNNGSALTTNFVGIITDASSWTRATGAGSPIYGDSGAVKPCTRVGATQVIGATAIAGIQISATPATGGRNLFFVDITKGSPNYTLTIWAKNSNGTVEDHTQTNLLTQAILASPSLSGNATGANRTIAADEVAGALNAVNLAWDRPNAQIEISDLVIVRLA